MRHRWLSFVVAGLLLGGGIASAQEILWVETYGQPGDRETAWGAAATADGGFAMVGYEAPPLEGGGGADDFHLVKVDSQGAFEWSRTWGGFEGDWLTAVVEHPDGGYVVAGMYGLAPFVHDAYLARTDALGNLVWEHRYDGAGLDTRAQDVWPTSDGGYAVVGQQRVPNGPFESYDVRLIRTDGAGNVAWDRLYRREEYGNDVGLAVEETADGGFVIAGSTQSSAWACYLLRVDAQGNLLWDQVYGGGFAGGSCDDLEQTPAGNIVATGCSTPAGDCQTFLVSTDADGVELWSREFGGASDDSGHALLRRPDGGFALAGISSSSTSGWAVDVIRTDADGNPLWQQSWGGDLDDRGLAIAPAAGGLAVAGFTTPVGQSSQDVLLIKVADAGPLFADGFESGDPSAWTLVVP